MNTYNVETVISKTGEETISVNGYFLHSKYNPLEEAKRISEENYVPHHVHIVFGYGKGYIIEALSNLFDYDEKIIVIDPLIEQKVLEINKDHTYEERICYWAPEHKNTLSYLINNLSTVRELKVKVVISPQYNKLFAPEIKNILELVRDHQYKNIVNQNTLIAFAESWQKNLLYNIAEISKDFSLKALHKKYDCPVVVASGGPSLTKQIPLLKKHKDQIIIICAGSTINSLRAQGIEPNYVVSVDGGVPNFDHFKDLKLKDPYFIYSLTSHHGIRKSFHEDKGFAFCPTNYPRVTKYIKNKFNIDLPLIVGGGTVAHFSLSIAKYITTGPIAMIGQDLAYTNDLTHAENNKHAKKIDAVEEGKIVYTEGYYGDQVKTTKVFISMQSTFEDVQKFLPHDAELYNCTEGGIKLKGYDQMPFKEFIGKFVADVPIIEDIELKKDVAEQLTNEQLIEIWKQELTIYNQVLRLLVKAKTLLKRNPSKTMFTQGTLKKLDAIDKKLSEKYIEIQLDFLIQPLVLEIQQSYIEKPNETEVEKYERVYNQSEKLYSNLFDLVQQGRDYILEIIETLQED